MSLTLTVCLKGVMPIIL